MKFNPINSVIALAISFLIVYGFCSLDSNTNRILVGAGGFIFLSATLVMMIGITFEYPRTALNLKIVSGIFFVLALLSNLIFSLLNLSYVSYVITNGIILLVFALIARTIYLLKQ